MTNYIRPVASRVTQGFGANAAFYMRAVGQKGHNGIDYGAPSGTPVKATQSGVIAFEGWGGSLGIAGKVAGIYVLINHKTGYSGYAHLSSTIVNRGQRVKQGQVIGYTGSTGLASGPHLHFETLPLHYNLANGYYGRVNPSKYHVGEPNPKPRPASRTATVTRAANVRTSPRLKSTIVKQLRRGQKFQYVGTVKGDTVEQHGVRTNVWLKTTGSHYVWRGNVKI